LEDEPPAGIVARLCPFGPPGGQGTRVGAAAASLPRIGGGLNEPIPEDEDAAAPASGKPEIQLPRITVRRETPKVGRNDPCPCGSGKKYKHCHGK